MRILKCLVVFAIAFCAVAGVSNAQQSSTLQFLGGGSSAIFLELGQGAVALTGTPTTACYWTHAADTTNVLARDARTSPATDENGKSWVVWTVGGSGGTCTSPATGFQVYMYMSLDSVLGDRCYFENDGSGTPGCVQVLTVAGGTAGSSPSLFGTGYTDTAIPSTVISAINGKHWFAAGTDIRPEDAKFASLRMFTACGASIGRAPFHQGLSTVAGLGYQTSTTGVGTPIQSFYSTTTFDVLDFNIAGNDPIKTTQPVPAYTVSTVGGQPILVAVAPAGGTGIGAATDITSFTLSQFYEGVLGRDTDLNGPTAGNPVVTLVREPLSGTYNTFEYSNPNSSQFRSSQDDNNCNGNVVFSNPMHLQSTNGNIVAFRNRVIGTSEMVAELQAAGGAGEERLGYFFWSSANGSKFTATNGKYLTVDGVDPLLPSYSSTCGGVANNGVIPTGTNLSCITFQNLNSGDYPIWSAVRIVSTSPTPAGVTSLINSMQSLATTQNDLIPLAKLAVWHSHFALPAINVGAQANGATINPATPNDLCNPTGGAIPENGGDAGGSNVLKQNNANFCHDFGNGQGLINRNN